MSALGRVPLIGALSIAAAIVCGPQAMARAPLPGQHGHFGPYMAPFVATPGTTSGTWQHLINAFPGAAFPDTALLLTDGTVMMHDGCTRHWFKLTPDNTGSYVNGTWTQTANMPAAYQPLYVASQVLPDGRLIVQGGEYNRCEEAFTTLGALYDPVANQWTAVPPPTGWASIGDAQSVVLADGTYMVADCCGATLGTGPEAALATINGTTVTFTSTGTGKADDYDEEGWTILPDQTILTVDAALGHTLNHSQSEIYTAATGAWSRTANTTARIEDPSSEEIGPAVLMPNGKVLQIAGNSDGSANARSYSNIYDPLARTWSKGPVLPKVGGAFYSAEDAPAALLPSGNILVQLSPAYTCSVNGSLSAFCAPSHFFEYNGTGFVQVSEPADAPNIASFEGRMLVLPTGQILWSSDTGDVEVYTPRGTPKDTWRPTISSAPTKAKLGSKNNVVHGTMFNGLSLGASYGDDAQMSTNYPLVRITNNATGHVCYARTHDHATMGISDGGTTSTRFDVPATCEAGVSKLQVIANGIASVVVRIRLL
ncbi:MAG TPA: hypothetical protein VGG69_11140 [Rhizomicrobium sp.]